MKIILTLAVLSVLVWGCATKQFPTSPPIKKHYLIEVRDEHFKLSDLGFIDQVETIPQAQQVVRCLEFDIVSWHPYKIKFSSEVSMAACNLTGGYRPSDIQNILNWIDDVYLWAKDRKRCIKL